MTLGTVMSAEMAEQPERLAALLSRSDEIMERVRKVLPDRLAGTVLVARGSSDHAATTGRYLLELATGRPVASASPSLYTMYGAQTDFTGYLVIAVSQSGRTPEIVKERERKGTTNPLPNRVALVASRQGVSSQGFLNHRIHCWSPCVCHSPFDLLERGQAGRCFYPVKFSAPATVKPAIYARFATSKYL